MERAARNVGGAVTSKDIERGLFALGVRRGMMLEVHCALSAFGRVEGGAEAVVSALQAAVGPEGAIVMPAFRLSKNQPLTECDQALGIRQKIRILPEDAERSAMGIVADTFRHMPGVEMGEGIFRVCAWGKDARLHAASGFQRVIDKGGHALLLGVDIYRLSAMHYVEDALPDEIRKLFVPKNAEVRQLYPEDAWFIEVWAPENKPWYVVQDRAYEQGLITDGVIGGAQCMFFGIADVIEIYRRALIEKPFELYGIEGNGGQTNDS